ncbi:CopD family protein [Neolewinella antarctica]|uniref:Protoporphyrinogen IX oxidase n=1 Tax=Neolewinella antarctica TaxID=442734 RepID=A0ABX0XAT8_9BACT|nr:CopD family protein [Neolewinella antarctica]NJC26378.1 putative membrane protein [Neolewinella antarctica]
MNAILIAKALHVIGFVSWFAGLFYLGRVLVNHAETDKIAPLVGNTPEAIRNRIKREVLHEEYSATADRVYRIIVRQAMFITLVAGSVMVVLNPGYFQAGTPGWLAVKLVFIAGMVAYQLYTKAKIMLPMRSGERPWSAWQLRLWNEVPTFFLVAIPFIATLGKAGELNYLYLGIGVAGFSFLVWRGAVAYGKRREVESGV